MEKAAHKTLNILLAEDDEDDRDFFKEAVEEIGNEMRLDTAKNGIELMQMLSHANTYLPDMIFLDLNMQQKNGHQCLVEIKSNSFLQQIPVIVYSTSSQPEQINSTYKEGANLYIRKPDSFTKLKSILKKVISLNWPEYFPQPKKEQFILQYQ